MSQYVKIRNCGIWFVFKWLRYLFTFLYKFYKFIKYVNVLGIKDVQNEKLVPRILIKIFRRIFAIRMILNMAIMIPANKIRTDLECFRISGNADKIIGNQFTFWINITFAKERLTKLCQRINFRAPFPNSFIAFLG